MPSATDRTTYLIHYPSRRDLEKALTACNAIEDSMRRIDRLVAEGKRELVEKRVKQQNPIFAAKQQQTS